METPHKSKKDISRLNDFLLKKNNQLYLSLATIIFLWFGLVYLAFYASNYFINKRTLENIHGQLKIQLFDSNYDQSIRFFNHLTSFELVTCLEVHVQDPQGSITEIFSFKKDLCVSKSELMNFKMANQQEWQIQIKSSTPQSLIFSAILLATGGASVIFSIFYFRQRTKDLKDKIESKERELKDRLFQATRKFAHDIRSPLTAIDSVTHHLKDSSPSSSSLLKMVSEKFRGMTDQYLTEIKGFSDPSFQQQITKSQLQDLVQKELEMKKAELEIENKTVHFEYLFSEEEQNRTYASPPTLAFARIISNLLNNAIESKEGIQTISVRLFESGEYLCLQVKDQGPGFPSDLLKKIGYQFLTTKRFGHGYGLYDARESLEKCGGLMELANDPGAVVTISLKSQERTQNNQ